MMKDIKIIVITGYSGSGKSTALDAFEDTGFFCVDNLPVVLLPKFLELPIQSPSGVKGLAFVMDLREAGFVEAGRSVFDTLRQKGYRFEILFLKAGEDVLIKRYSQTRRQHPMDGGKGLRAGILAEMEKLDGLLDRADRIIDTSHFSPHQLKAKMKEIAEKSGRAAQMNIQVMSFGFKYGLPGEADLVMDVRFLTNPYFVPELRPLSGKDEPVRRYVLDQPAAETFIKIFSKLIDFLIPLYEKEGKTYLTIAVGCTGGRHRSVAVARVVCDHLKQYREPVDITHRDMELESPA